MHYELLSLEWWQNPWYLWSLSLSAICGAIVIYALWYRFRPDPVYRALKRLGKAPLQTLEEQVVFCCALTDLMKRVHGRALHMTDQELVVLMNFSDFTRNSEKEKMVVSTEPTAEGSANEFGEGVTLVKFAQVRVPQERLKLHLRFCEEYYARIARERAQSQTVAARFGLVWGQKRGFVR